MASADAVFMAAHYKAMQRKMSESSNPDDKSRSRSNSLMDDIKDGVQKFTKNLSEKRNSFSGMRRRTMSCDVPDASMAPSGSKPDRLQNKRNQFWSIHQKSMDSRIQEQPEAEQAQARLYNKKNAKDLVRGRLQSAPVSSSRPRSESDVLPSRRYRKEIHDSDDDVFEEEEEPQPQNKDVTRL